MYQPLLIKLLRLYELNFSMQRMLLKIWSATHFLVAISQLFSHLPDVSVLSYTF